MAISNIPNTGVIQFSGLSDIEAVASPGALLPWITPRGNLSEGALADVQMDPTGLFVIKKPGTYRIKARTPSQSTAVDTVQLNLVQGGLTVVASDEATSEVAAQNQSVLEVDEVIVLTEASINGIANAFEIRFIGANAETTSSEAGTANGRLTIEKLRSS